LQYSSCIFSRQLFTHFWSNFIVCTMKKVMYFICFMSQCVLCLLCLTEPHNGWIYFRIKTMNSRTQWKSYLSYLFIDQFIWCLQLVTICTWIQAFFRVAVRCNVKWLSYVWVRDLFTCASKATIVVKMEWNNDCVPFFNLVHCQCSSCTAKKHTHLWDSCLKIASSSSCVSIETCMRYVFTLLLSAFLVSASLGNVLHCCFVLF
jgi:hypothetical protein